MNSKRKLSPSFATFLMALGISTAIFLPFIVYNGGVFMFLGDYNVQQIPFYKLAHEAVRSGDILWNHYTDLGANFIGSYSFYLLFSPFFWLTLPFPTSAVPYLMGPLFILKTSLTALTAYLYLKRFLSDHYYARLGGMLYAFSGFMTFNIFFNHFHDVVVFFPLLLIAVEELVVNNRKLFFAFMVFLSAIVNYWFFIGEVVFVIIYVFVRMSTGGWGMTAKKFMTLAFEAILGVGLAVVVLLPSVLAITGNPRTDTDNLLNGWLMWIYGYNQRLPSIIGSIFLPPELPSQPNFFPEQGAKWASLSAWLPLFSTVGVIAFLKGEKGKSFIRRLLLISLLFACFPILNSAFVLFNHSYYARWFYMPILFMCLATALSLERADRRSLKFGLSVTVGITAFICVAVGLSPVVEEGVLSIGLSEYPIRMWLYVLYVAVCLLLSGLLIFAVKGRENFKKLTDIAMSFCIIVFSICFIAMGKAYPSQDAWFLEYSVNGQDKFSEYSEGEFARIDIFEGGDNQGMFWGLPNIQAFHSIVPASIMEFYPEIGIKRDVSSKPPTTYTYLRSLLSVKWLFISESNENQSPMMGYTLHETKNGFNIYENQNYLPMGFGYDAYFDDELMEKLSDYNKSEFMLAGLHLDSEAIERNSDILTPLPNDVYRDVTADLDARRSMVADSFEISGSGFTSTVTAEKEMLMFYSVPYDEGWSATVNGEPVVIEKANVGFMAVRVPEGESTVQFSYFTPGLAEGAVVSLIFIAIFMLYALIIWRFHKKTPTPEELSKKREQEIFKFLDRLGTLETRD